MDEELGTAVTLEDLCGLRVLSGRGEMIVDDNAFVVVLRLDETFYWFQEDPDDGYRSSLGSVNKLLGWPQRMPTSAFIAFDPLVITLRVCTDPRGKVLYGVAEQTGLVLFEVGTDYSVDHYPSFVHRWEPEGVESPWFCSP